MTTKNAEPVIHNRIARRRVRRHRTSGFVWCGLTYDNAGNTTYIAAPTTGKTFVYGDHNRLTQVLNGATVAMHYVYNGMGERVRKYLNTANTYTLYDDTGRWIGDYGNAGAPTQQVIWLDDLPVGVLDGAGANQKLHYIEPDALGTPRVVIDRTRGASGVAIWRWDLTGEAFGNSAPNENPDGDATTFVFDMRFPGQRYDAASGLNYNYFREYEPGTGRYSQSDPIGLAGGMSTYGYVRGNSLSNIDPSGLIGYICKRGDVVGMAVLVNFRAAKGVNQADLDRIEKEIEQAWTGSFGEYTVALDVIQTKRTDQYVNKVTVIPGKTSSNQSWIGTIGEFMNTHAHEAGHWFELENNEIPRFRGQSVMAPIPDNGVRNVTWIDIQTLVDRRFHNVWKCGCD